MWDIPRNSLFVMVGVLILLAAASITWRLLAAGHPERDYDELRLRIQSWWWMVVVLFLCLAVSNTAAIVLFALVSFLALKEFLSIVPTRQTDRRVIFWAYLAIPIQYYWVASAWYGMFIIFIPIYIFLLLPIRMVLLGDTRGFIKILGDAETEKKLSDYGYHIGMVFQIADDLLDYIAETDTLGKAVGADLREGKLTLPLIHTLSRAGGEDREKIAAIVEKPSFSTDEFNQLLKIIDSYGGISYSQDIAGGHVEKAKAILAAFPSSETRETLSMLADYALSRGS